VTLKHVLGVLAKVDETSLGNHTAHLNLANCRIRFRSLEFLPAAS
jgi:hypothetical protein